MKPPRNSRHPVNATGGAAVPRRPFRRGPGTAAGPAGRCAPGPAREGSGAGICGGQPQMVRNPASPVAAGGRGGDLRSSADWEYAPAPESRDIVSIHDEYGLFIGGEFTAPLSGEHFSTVNPASEEPLASVAQAGQADVDRAAAAARQAYEQSWGTMPGRERAKYLYRIARGIQERARGFAGLESLG